MTTATERQSLQRCPACDRAHVLKVNGTRETGQRHECISCGYLQHWKPFPEWNDASRQNAQRVQDDYIRRTQR